MPPIAKGIYMVELIGVPITRIGILAMHGIQSNQDVHVYGIWWIGASVVFVANFYFYFCSLKINLSFDLGTFRGKNMGNLY